MYTAKGAAGGTEHRSGEGKVISDPGLSEGAHVLRKQGADARKQGMLPGGRARGDRVAEEAGVPPSQSGSLGALQELGRGGGALPLNSQEECGAHPWVRNLGFQTVR